MEDRETMQRIADKMQAGCDDLGNLPWGEKWSKALLDRFTGKTKRIPKRMLNEGLMPEHEDLLLAEVNQNWEGVSELLAQSIDFASSPEGEDFWHTVMNTFILYEKKLEDAND